MDRYVDLGGLRVGAGKDRSALQGQGPEAAGGARSSRLTSWNIILCHSQPPCCLMPHLHLPVVSPCGEALTAKHTVIIMEAPWVGLAILRVFIFLKPHWGARLGQGQIRMGCVRVKGHWCNICRQVEIRDREVRWALLLFCMCFVK